MTSNVCRLRQEEGSPSLFRFDVAPPRSQLLAVGMMAFIAGLGLGANASAQRRDIWKGQPGPVDALAVSPDGKTLASSTRSGKEVQVWDLASKKQTATLALGPKTLIGVAEFTSDSKYLITTAVAPPRQGGRLGSLDDLERSVQVWELATGKVSLNIDLLKDMSGCLIAPAGKSLVALGWKTGKVVLYDLSSGKPSEPSDLGKYYHDISAAALSPDGKTLAVGTATEGILLWDMEKKAARATIPHDKVNGAPVLAFSPDGKTLAGGFRNGAATLWDASNGNSKAQLDFRPRVSLIETIVFSPDGKTVAVGGAHWGVSLWDLGAGGVRDDFDGDLRTFHVLSLAFTPDGKTLITGGFDPDKGIWYWDLPQGQPAGVKPAGTLTPAERAALKKFDEDGKAKPPAP